MIARMSTVAFIVAILAWPVFAVGWIPGGLLVTAIISVVCFLVSYLCYRVLRVRNDAEQIAHLRVMQERDRMSDEELLSYVLVHHPYLLDGFAKGFTQTLSDSVDAKERKD